MNILNNPTKTLVVFVTLVYLIKMHHAIIHIALVISLKEYLSLE